MTRHVASPLIMHPDQCAVIRKHFGLTENPEWLIESPELPKDGQEQK